MGQTEKAFLGTGWNFPLAVDAQTGRIMTVSQEEDIEQSIRIILSTRIGERVMQAEFGCEIHKFMFANIQEDELADIRHCVVEALRRWEPRVIEVKVVTDTSALSSGKLILNLSYVVRATNTPFNLVFPFYIQEGL